MGRVENAESLAAELGCNVGSLPTVYIGISLRAKHNSLEVWNGVEERFRRRLALWKRRYISKGGRLTYKKHPIQHAHLHHVPFSIT